jgi:hypothetical protein
MDSSRFSAEVKKRSKKAYIKNAFFGTFRKMRSPGKTGPRKGHVPDQDKFRLLGFFLGFFGDFRPKRTSTRRHQTSFNIRLYMLFSISSENGSKKRSPRWSHHKNPCRSKLKKNCHYLCYFTYVLKSS